MIIDSTNIKHYIKVSKNCYISEYISFRSGSSLKLDISDVQKKKEIILIFKNISGDGKININNETFIVNSRISQQIVIEPFDILDINRINYVGEVQLLHIIINTQNFDMTNSWKNILSKCGTYKLLNVTPENRLLAAEGAVIQSDNIKLIKTIPELAYSRINNTYKFVFSCEISEIQLYDYSPKEQPPPFPHIETPQTHINDIPVPQEIYAVSNIRQNIISAAKDIRKHGGEGVILGRRGSFYIPMAGLEPNTTYDIVIGGRKLQGNGKVIVSIDTTADKHQQCDSNIIIFQFGRSEYKIKLNSGNMPSPGDSYCVKFSRPDTAVGELFIDKISVIKQNDIQNINFESITINNVDIPNISEYVSNIKDSVARNAKKFSRTRVATIDDNAITDLEYSISSSVISGMYWCEKASHLISKLTISGSSTIILSDIFNLKQAEAIWLDVFDDSANINLTQNGIDILKGAKFIISPSDSNIEYLEKLLDKKVIKSERPWPAITPAPLPEIFNTNYGILFDRNDDIIKNVIDNWEWKDGSKKLVILGGRGRYPSFVIPTNEYLRYNILFSIIKNSKFILDFPKISYKSGALTLCSSFGLPILTSNKEYSEYDNIISANVIDNNVENLSALLQDTASHKLIQDNKLATHNNLLMGFFNKLLGKL